MPRRQNKSLKRDISPDRKYNSVLVQKLINKVMKQGRKKTAEKLVYDALTQLEDKSKKPALEAFEAAMKNITPNVEVKSRRVGGANYQIPFEVKGDRQRHLALMWLVQITRAKKGVAYSTVLARELEQAIDNQGDVVKKREDTHKMAEANRAFAHLARF